jgi:hypothetical protein
VGDGLVRVNPKVLEGMPIEDGSEEKFASKDRGKRTQEHGQNGKEPYRQPRFRLVLHSQSAATRPDHR